MVQQRLPILVRTVAAVVLGLGWSAGGAWGVGHAVGGHGGGAGHPLAGGGFRGGFCGPGFRGYHRGFYGYPGWYYGPGLGFGLGLGMGYGLGYGYGYPYYGYGPAYPIYVDAGCAVPAYGVPPAGPATGPGAAPAPAGSSPPPGGVRLTDSDVLLSIRVPPEAIVKINGVQTNQNGPRREFMSSGLLPGRTYTFVVAARWTGPNGKAVELEQRVPVQGGERRNIDFLTQAPPPPNDPPLER